MPQPFIYQNNNNDVLIHGVHALEQRPALSIGIAKICTQWSWLEQNLAILFVNALAGAQGAALAIYNTFVDRRLKSEAFKAVIAARKSDELNQKSGALFINVDKLAKRRNYIIHGAWSALERRPNSLLLWGQTERANRLFEIDNDLRERQDNNLARSRGELADSEWNEKRKIHTISVKPLHFTEYTAADFDQLLLDIRKSDAQIAEISNLLRLPL
ncbi:hypothetical protein [Humitalea rosea]|uniref:hypothetical protein n=1 Tax=Humitalea rosea TaxID=990373 RepID=UPI0011B49F06|nr:hypothetical protein [Humitalea rosea]